MSVNTADIAKAVNTLWDAQTLDATFKVLWDSDVTASEWEVLHDMEASPDQPNPYTVFEVALPVIASKMSGAGNQIREIRDVPLSFDVYAKEVSGDSRTAKEIAAFLAEEIMKVFGGHPTNNPQVMTLDNGNFLIAQYLNDFSVRVGDEEFQWTINYNVKVDVPVAV